MSINRVTCTWIGFHHPSHEQTLSDYTNMIAYLHSYPAGVRYWTDFFPKVIV